MNKIYLKFFLVIAVISALSFTAGTNYLLFHSIVELFSIIIACLLFVITWNSYRYIQNQYLQFVGIAYLFIAALDLLHTLSFKGMSVFKDYDYYANQLWIAARYLESFSLLTGLLFLRGKLKLNRGIMLALYALISTALAASIIHFRIFPECFVEGQGQTRFKIISEYIICCILLLNMVLLHRNRDRFDEKIYYMLLWSMFLTILSELSFTVYVDNYGISNMVGHYFKIGSYYLVYRAVIETGIVQPYNIIFREYSENQKMLENALRAAEKANRLKSEFIAGVSHEIRTPMNAIIGFTGILIDGETDEKKSARLSIIDEAGRHLLNLINNILDLSKVEAGKLVLHPLPYYVRKIFERVISILSVQSSKKKIALLYEADDSLPAYLVCDPDRITQVLFNLAGNAIKFTNEGSVSIISSYNDGFLYIEVRDTGTGIPESKLPMLFTPYEQPTELFDDEHRGTGLGLPISKMLVELMGGEISVKSAEGRGTCFFVKIPLAVSDVPAGLSSASDDGPAALPPGSGYRVLVAEDNETNMLLMRHILKKLNVEFDTAGNGHEAVEKLKADPAGFDLLLLDDRMPVMDGSETLKVIRSDPQFKGLKVVMVTANVTRDEVQRYFELGCDDFIPKPIDRKEFNRKLIEYYRIKTAGK
jgi:signal transduction histidine kinase/ActR/RegA family two-component response regulator